jgi:hypothetical protein
MMTKGELDRILDQHIVLSERMRRLVHILAKKQALDTRRECAALARKVGCEVRIGILGDTGAAVRLATEDIATQIEETP